MNKLWVAVAGLFAVVLLGIFAKDKIQTMLFDRTEFVDCFESEMISSYQSEEIRKGKVLSGILEGTMSPQIKSSANSIVDRVKNNGLDRTLNQVSKEVDAQIDEFLKSFSADGGFPEKTTYEIIAESEKNCLERQLLW